jgi:hypothetical protein
VASDQERHARQPGRSPSPAGRTASSHTSASLRRHRFHPRLGVALASGGSGGDGFRDALDVARVETAASSTGGVSRGPDRAASDLNSNLGRRASAAQALIGLAYSREL